MLAVYRFQIELDLLMSEQKEDAMVKKKKAKKASKQITLHLNCAVQRAGRRWPFVLAILLTRSNLQLGNDVDRFRCYGFASLSSAGEERSPYSASLSLHAARYRLDEASRLDGFPRTSAVPVIAIPLTRRCTAASAVHSADSIALHCGCAAWLPRSL
jgi:hypothetical protein